MKYERAHVGNVRQQISVEEAEAQEKAGETPGISPQLRVVEGKSLVDTAVPLDERTAESRAADEDAKAVAARQARSGHPADATDKARAEKERAEKEKAEKERAARQSEPARPKPPER